MNRKTDLKVVRRRLVEAFEGFEIIDCHEHLGPEQKRVGTRVDVFTLFSHYTRGDLRVAGISEADLAALSDCRIPVARRWTIFGPYWERIRWTSYSRSALLAAERFYGCDDINEKTCIPITEAMQAANTPGLYDRVLRDACGIRTALTQCGSTDLGTPLLTPVMPLVYTGEMETWETLAHPSFDSGAAVRSLDDYVDAVRRYVVRVKGEGAVGLKVISSPFGTPDRQKALEAFELLRGGNSIPCERGSPVLDYVVDRAIAYAGEQDMVVAVHAGYWGDFREMDPLHMIPFFQRHPGTRFDVYHLGYPWVRETLMLGKGFPNVWINLCWTHIISQRFVVAALDEAMDLIPMNKILAFGGDYALPVEKIYGHLVMAREDIAQVLAGRILDGGMTETQAVEIALKWFWENPKELYRLT